MIFYGWIFLTMLTPLAGQQKSGKNSLTFRRMLTP
jgi:hypothetical protein